MHFAKQSRLGSYHPASRGLFVLYGLITSLSNLVKQVSCHIVYPEHAEELVGCLEVPSVAAHSPISCLSPNGIPMGLGHLPTLTWAAPARSQVFVLTVVAFAEITEINVT